MPTGSYQNNKEKLSKEALEWFQNLLEKKKKKARILPWTLQKSLPEYEKQGLVEYRRNYYIRLNNNCKATQ